MNRNFLKLFSIFFAFSGLVLKIQSYPTLCTWKNKDNKNIIVISDRHQSIETENIYKAIFDEWINKLALSGESIHFLLEKNETWNKIYQLNPMLLKDPNLMLMEALNWKAFLNNSKINNLRFIDADRRTKLISLTSMLDKLKPHDLGLDKEKLEVYILDVLKFINNWRELDKKTGKNKADSLSINDEAKNKIKEIIAILIQNIEEIKKLGIDFLNKTIAEFYQYISGNKQSELKNLNSLLFSISKNLADLGYIEALLNSINESNFIIAHVGTNHAVSMSDFLNKMGFVSKREIIGGYELNPPKGQVSINNLKNISPEFLQKTLDEFIQKLPKNTIAKDDGKMPISSSDSEQVKKICAQCNIGLSGDNIKRCSACRQVNYCSQDCQRKDWPRHKPNCKNQHFRQIS